MKTNILALTTSVPQNCYQQKEIYQAISAIFGDNPRSESIFLNSGINTRYSVLEKLNDFYFSGRKTTKERNEVYQQEAFLLCQKTIEKCLAEANVRAGEIDDLIIVSCTGVNIPGLDIFLAKSFGMKPELQRTSILFMGCYAAFPGLRKALEYTKAKPGSKSLVVCVELCSIHFQYNDSIENIVSSSLFADGCAAILLESGAESSGLPVLLDSQVLTSYETTEHMAFILTDEGFQMNLSAYVPEILRANIDPFVDKLLAKNNLLRSDIRHWLIHPGGVKIVNYLQQELNLSDDVVSSSRKVLAQYGNMSSPTILFVLDELIKSGKCQKGDLGVMMAFGPGLTMESILLRWD